MQETQILIGLLHNVVHMWGPGEVVGDVNAKVLLALQPGFRHAVGRNDSVPLQTLSGPQDVTR